MYFRGGFWNIRLFMRRLSALWHGKADVEVFHFSMKDLRSVPNLEHIYNVCATHAGSNHCVSLQIFRNLALVLCVGNKVRQLAETCPTPRFSLFIIRDRLRAGLKCMGTVMPVRNSVKFSMYFAFSWVARGRAVQAVLDNLFWQDNFPPKILFFLIFGEKSLVFLIFWQSENIMDRLLKFRMLWMTLAKSVRLFRPHFV